MKNGSIFSQRNKLLILLSVVALVVGYVLLGQGPVYNPLSWTVAPVLLVIAYCALIPIAILAKGDKKEEENDTKGA